MYCTLNSASSKVDRFSGSDLNAFRCFCSEKRGRPEQDHTCTASLNFLFFFFKLLTYLQTRRLFLFECHLNVKQAPYFFFKISKHKLNVTEKCMRITETKKSLKLPANFLIIFFFCNNCTWDYQFKSKRVITPDTDLIHLLGFAALYSV